VFQNQQIIGAQFAWTRNYINSQEILLELNVTFSIHMFNFIGRILFNIPYFT